MNPVFLSISPRASRNLALAALPTLGLAWCGGGNKTKDHLREHYKTNPEHFEKYWGVGDGVDKPMPGKDRFRR